MTLRRTWQPHKMSNTCLFSDTTDALKLFDKTEMHNIENPTKNMEKPGSLKTYLQSFRCTDANPTKNRRPSGLQPISACT